MPTTDLYQIKYWIESNCLPADLNGFEFRLAVNNDQHVQFKYGAGKWVTLTTAQPYLWMHTTDQAAKDAFRDLRATYSSSNRPQVI